MDSSWLGLVVAAYLLGAVPFGLVVARLWGGPDPRRVGSGNIGATNVARTVSKPAGVVTLLLDVAKGALPAALALGWQGPEQLWLAPLTGLAAFLGHCWPVYLRFKGGKGVATAMGVYLSLAPTALLGILAIFVLLAWKTGHVSVGSLASCTSAPLWMLISGQNLAVVMVTLVMALVVIYRHKDNLARLRQGAEHGWR